MLQAKAIDRLPKTVQVGEERFKLELKKNAGKPLLVMREGKKQVLQLSELMQ